jgi:hypothetical protein
VDLMIHIFLTLVLGGSEWSASCPGHFTPMERTPSTHCIGGWVNLRAGLDDVVKRKFLTLLELKLQTLGCPDHSHLLYRL